MYDNDYLKLVDEEERRIFILIDILNDLIEILNKLMDREKLIPRLQKHIKEISNITIESQFDFKNDKIQIKKSKIFLDIFTNDEIKEINEHWKTISIKLIEEFYQKFKKKLISHFQTLILEKYIPNTHEKDLDLIDPLLLKLEKLQA